jgi:acetyl esterase/lipase
MVMVSRLALLILPLASHLFAACPDTGEDSATTEGVYEDFRPAIAPQPEASKHLLVLSREDAQEAEAKGRLYRSHDWLCDATGFRFVAVNNYGVYEPGDAVPRARSRIFAELPAPAALKLFRGATLARETFGKRLEHDNPEAGEWRLEAWLGDQLWIESGILRLTGMPPALTLPSQKPDAGVEVEKDIPYLESTPAHAAKHKLDLYLPKGVENPPVLFFVHGGSWRNGDRSIYPFFGNLFARQGIAVVIPSYRLSPANQHPAHIEDVAAAFAWAHKRFHKPIHIAGHSAGGHLVALLALDESHLARHGLTNKEIVSVFALSGVYDVGKIDNVFTADIELRKQASPLTYVRPGMASPPFLITYCQWDYPYLPAQARRFHQALRGAGVNADLVYIPNEDHISEMAHIVKTGDLTAKSILDRIRK